MDCPIRVVAYAAAVTGCPETECQKELCPMWRIIRKDISQLEEEDATIGYCGLAGKPEQL